MKNKKLNTIWYPGSFNADEEWINYLRMNYKGLWYFSDTQRVEPIWAVNQEECTFIIELDTLSERAKMISETISPELVVLSMHPGLHDSLSINIWLAELAFSPKRIIYCDSNTVEVELNGYRKIADLSRRNYFVTEYERLDLL